MGILSTIPVMKQRGFDHKLFEQGALMQHRVTGNAYFDKTDFPVQSVRQKLAVSFYIKPSKLATIHPILQAWYNSQNRDYIFLGGDRKLGWYTEDGGVDYGTTWSYEFADPNAWYHILILVDSTLADQDKRKDLYINGEYQSNAHFTHSWGAHPQNHNFNLLASTRTHWIGYENAINTYAQMQLCDFHVFYDFHPSIDDFGRVYRKNERIFEPKKPKFTQAQYGASGFHLGGGIAMGYDSSGNANHWKARAVDPVGQPTEGYCFWNHLDKDTNIKVQSHVEHQSRVNFTATMDGFIRGNLGMSSGVYYWEVDIMSTMNAYDGVGISNASGNVQNVLGSEAGGYAYNAGGHWYGNGVATTNQATTYTSGDRIGVKLDLDAGNVEFFKNGVSQGAPFGGLTGTFYPAICFNGSPTRDMSARFQSANWIHAPAGITAANEVRIENGAVYNPHFLHGGTDKHYSQLDASTKTGGTLSNNDMTFSSIQHSVLSEAVISQGKHRWDVSNMNIPTNQYSNWTGIIRSDQSVGNWASTQTMYHNDLAYSVVFYGHTTTPKAIAYKNQVTLGREILITDGSTLNFYFDADAGTLHVGQDGGTPILMHENIPISSYKIGISDASNTTMTVEMVMDAQRLSLSTPAAGFEDYKAVNESQTFPYIIDSPSDNAATLNPLVVHSGVTTTYTMSEGNTKVSGVNHGSTALNFLSTMPVSSGKWYAEMHVTTQGQIIAFGIKDTSSPLLTTSHYGLLASDIAYYSDHGAVNHGLYVGNVVTAYGSQINDGNIIGMYLDLDNNTIEFADEGVKQGSVSIPNTTYLLGCLGYGNSDFKIAFGESEWVHGPDDPAFKAMRTSNKPKPKYQGNNYFGTLREAGTGTTQTFTGLKFKPDLVVSKGVNIVSGMQWASPVLGTGKFLQSNSTSGLISNAGAISSFIDGGFIAEGLGGLNGSGEDVLHTCLKQGPHLQVVSYVGDGVQGRKLSIPDEGSLGTKWQMGIIKATVDENGDPYTSDWAVYHEAAGNTHRLLLNSNVVAAPSSAYWGNIDPTHNEATLGNSSHVNQTGVNYISVWFRSVAGLCTVGSYAGTNTADGGLLPTSGTTLLAIRKAMSQSNDWCMQSKASNPYNPVERRLALNTSAIEDSGPLIDFNSHNLKARSTGYNGIGTYICLALNGATDGAKTPPINGQ